MEDLLRSYIYFIANISQQHLLKFYIIILREKKTHRYASSLFDIRDDQIGMESKIGGFVHIW